MSWTVGQEVFVVQDRSTRYGSTYHARITKVARRWVTVERVGVESKWLPAHRFDRETGQLDGGGFSSPGRVYTSEAEYVDRKLATHYRRQIRDRLYGEGRASADDVRKAAELLGIPLTEPEA